MIVKINSIGDVQRFNKICSHADVEEIDLCQGRYVVDAKSVMGIFSLNLLEPIKVVAQGSDDEISAFYEQIKEWEV